MRWMLERRRLAVAIMIAAWLSAWSSNSFGQGIFGHKRPRTDCPGVTNVEELGALIDQLDARLYRLGKVVVKSPDVWGQNRMTRYRAAFDHEMLKEQDRFHPELQAYQRRSDSAALTSATAIGIAVQPKAPAGRAPTTTNTTTVAVPAISTVGIPNGLTDNAKDLIGTMTPVIDAATIGKLNLALSHYDSGGIGLDPGIMLDEKADYLNHLQRLQRINSGDDVTDTPGYSLYLMRMPVSILPGPASEKGKGAVVTVEAKHALTTDLLPTTFKKVLILDTTYQLKEVVEQVLHGEVNLKGKTSFMPAQILRTVPRLFAFSMSGTGASFRGQASASELVDLYGAENLNAIVEEIRNDDSSLPHDDSSVLSRLINELSVAHDFLRERTRRGDQAFGIENVHAIGNLALTRNYAELKKLRTKFLIGLINARNGATVCPVLAAEGDILYTKHIKALDVLVFALIVQSAFVDRTLKQDMEVTGRRAGGIWGDPSNYFFFEPEPSLEARMAFNAYVEKKWPIHVFSIDPAIDQQNELDAYSRRSELQLALAVAVASGKMNVQNATTYARRLEEDIETVGLNRTAIAFGAGETTFGWRFYPRVQSPPDPSNPQRFAGLLLFGGPAPNYDVRHRRIEPGARECVAALVVPDFIPSLRMTTVSNWFGLIGSHGEKKLETTEMLQLGRMVQTARAGFRHLCDVGLYRPGDLERLNDRLTQLEALLPMQTYDVRLPFEGDLNGSDIFSSEGAGLAPRLLTYFGEPPQVGVESAVFLLGTGFSVINSKCVAGGVTVAPELISRNVIRIVIPKNARFLKASKLDIDGKSRTLIDVHIATPNGISNHLYVEANPAEPVCAPNAVAVGSPIAVDQGTTTLAFRYNPGPPRTIDGLDDKQTPIKLLWVDPTNPPPAKIELCLSFKANDGSLFKIAVDGPLYLNAKDKSYVIETNGLNRLAEEYLAQFGDKVVSLSTSCVEVRAIGDARSAGPYAAGNALRFEPIVSPPTPPLQVKATSLNQTPKRTPSADAGDVVPARYRPASILPRPVVRANLPGARTPPATKPNRGVQTVKPATPRANP